MVAAVLPGALAVGGCSYNLSSLLSKDDAAVTGSVSRSDHAVAQPREADLVYARAAAADALGRADKDGSVPWENPQSGAGGNITPLASFYREGSFTCRDFLASYVHGELQTWLQGEACRAGEGKWQVKSLTPLTRG